MSRIRNCLLIPAAFVCVALATTGEASANCMHGLLRCGFCGAGAGGFVPGAPVAFGAPISNAPQAQSAPTFAFPGASLNQAQASPTAFAPTAFAPTAFAPTGYYYAAPMSAPAQSPVAFSPTASSPGAILQGYSAAAPIVDVPAGTPLITGQLFGSHIFKLLGRFGQGLDRSGLLDLAVKGFSDATRGILPTVQERQILENIVSRFLGSGGSGGTGSEGSSGGSVNLGANGGSGLVRIVVTVEVPAGAKVTDVQVNPTGQTGQTSGQAKPNDGQAKRDGEVPEPVAPPDFPGPVPAAPAAKAPAGLTTPGTPTKPATNP